MYRYKFSQQVIGLPSSKKHLIFIIPNTSIGCYNTTVKLIKDRHSIRSYIQPPKPQHIHINKTMHTPSRYHNNVLKLQSDTTKKKE